MNNVVILKYIIYFCFMAHTISEEVFFLDNYFLDICLLKYAFSSFDISVIC